MRDEHTSLLGGRTEERIVRLPRGRLSGVAHLMPQTAESRNDFGLHVLVRSGNLRDAPRRHGGRGNSRRDLRRDETAPHEPWSQDSCVPGCLGAGLCDSTLRGTHGPRSTRGHCRGIVQRSAHRLGSEPADEGDPERTAREGLRAPSNSHAGGHSPGRSGGRSSQPRVRHPGLVLLSTIVTGVPGLIGLLVRDLRNAGGDQGAANQ